MSSISFADSSSGGVGFNFGFGLPFLTQAGLNLKLSSNFGISAGYNALNLDAGEASAKLTMPEVLLHYHPFSGAFFIAAGAGQETLEVKATDAASGGSVKIDVDASTTIIKLGWMWGSADGGFWFGMDVSHISPSGSKSKITATNLPTTDEAYIDAVDAADKFGETAYTNLTFARFGWLF